VARAGADDPLRTKLLCNCISVPLDYVCVASRGNERGDARRAQTVQCWASLVRGAGVMRAMNGAGDMLGYRTIVGDRRARDPKELAEHGWIRIEAVSKAGLPDVPPSPGVRVVEWMDGRLEQRQRSDPSRMPSRGNDSADGAVAVGDDMRTAMEQGCDVDRVLVEVLAAAGRSRTWIEASTVDSRQGPSLGQRLETPPRPDRAGAAVNQQQLRAAPPAKNRDSSHGLA
jgi:hypothetical protein